MTACISMGGRLFTGVWATDTLFPATINFQESRREGWDHMIPSSRQDTVLKGLILWRCCAGNHSYSEFMCNWPCCVQETSFFVMPLCPIALTFFPSPSSTMYPEPWW